MNNKILLDRYILQENLGRGSSGEVDLAWDSRIRRNVAIKRIPLPARAYASSIPGLEEARTGAQLHDARIVNVFDFEISDREAFLIMEFVDGMSLGTLMDRVSEMLSLDEIASIVQNVGKALQHAHNNHVLHLDVKPDNILINSSGMSKVTDFGIARLASSEGFGFATAGTIGYMPPEQLQGQEVDEKTDQWAFASMIYELIVGENPFVAKSFTESLQVIQTAEIFLPSAINEDLDTGADDVLFKALNPNPAIRYDSIADFVTELMPYLGKPKSGRGKLKKHVKLLADPIILGSPEERMRSMLESSTSLEENTPPISENDEDFYDSDTTENFDEYYDDEDDYYDSRRLVPKLAIRNCIGERGSLVIGKIVNAASTGTVMYLGVGAMEIPFWFAPWVAAAVGAVLGAIIPRIAFVIAFLSLGIGIIAAGWVPNGVILLAICAIWWLAIGKDGQVEAGCGLLAPALGLINLGYLQPLACGYFLSIKKATITALFSAAIMMILCPITSSQELSALNPQIEHYATTSSDLSYIYYEGSIWINAGAWIAAALVMSLLAEHRSKAISLAGVGLSIGIIVVLRMLGRAVFDQDLQLFTPNIIISLVISALIGLIVIWLHDQTKTSRP